MSSFFFGFQASYHLYIINISNNVKKVCNCKSNDFHISLKGKS